MTSVTSASKGFDKAAFIVFEALLFLTPVFFIPSISVPFEAGRAAFMLFGTLAVFVLWILARLKDGSFEVPRTWLYAGIGLFALAYTLSAVLSPNHALSYLGSGFDLGSLSFFLPSLALLALVPLVVRSTAQIFYSYAALIASFFLVAIFHAIRFVGGPDVLSFGIFTSATSAVIGKWNDLGIFSGLVALMSLITLEKASLSRLMKTLVYASLALSIALLAIINFSPVWIALAALSLVFFVYKVSFERGGTKTHIPYHALAVLVLSVVFAFGGAKIGGMLADALGTSQVEVRPSLGATLDVAKEALKKNPLFGAGPDRFVFEWLSSKPQGINNTVFWNTDFDYGIGFVPTLVSTTGLVGTAAALAFLVLLASLAVRSLFKQGTAPFSRYLVLSSLFGSMFLWVFAVIYVPSTGLWILTVAVTGLFVASLREDKVLEVRRASVIDRPGASFVSVLVSVLALIGAAAFAYAIVVNLSASIYYQRGAVAAAVKGDLDTAEKDVVRAIEISPSDVYYRSLSGLYLARINALFQDQKATQAEAQKQFQSLLASAIQSAQASVSLDSTNYQNHIALGRVYESVVPLKIEGAYESAKKSYEAALSANPSDPEIYLMLARLEATKGDSKAAKDYIGKALEKKGDYADAIFLLSQIQIAEGDVSNAINSVSAVATLSPSDPGIFFQLGLLYYSQKNYQNSALALERALALSPEYANAKYFLGLAYYQLGAKDKALAQFQDLAKSNPDNEELKAAVSNLEAGKPPFPGSANPVSRQNLPVEEKKK